MLFDPAYDGTVEDGGPRVQVDLFSASGRELQPKEEELLPLIEEAFEEEQESTRTIFCAVRRMLGVSQSHPDIDMFDFCHGWISGGADALDPAVTDTEYKPP